MNAIASAAETIGEMNDGFQSANGGARVNENESVDVSWVGEGGEGREEC